MRLLLATGSVVACAIAVAAACGGSGDGGSGLFGGGGAGASSGTLGTSAGGSGAGSSTCDPPCGDGQFCSGTGVCIDDGTCAHDVDCGDGLICDTDTGVCVPGGGCAQQEATLEAVPPNLMIVLDRSCSMRRDLSNTLNQAGPNKWTYSIDAITQMTTTYVDQIYYGLILFPDIVMPACQQDLAEFPCAPGNEGGIQTLLAAAATDTNDPQYPNGPCVTNIDTAIEQASLQVELADPNRRNYALLITDGKQANCGGNNAAHQATIVDLQAMFASGITTFVVGFGGGVDPARLDELAVAGGAPLMGSPQYYQADDAMQLQAALDTIASETLGCVFTLDTTPEDPSQIFVFINNDPMQIPRNTSDGWEYDPATNQVEFFGPLCDQITDGTITDVDIVLGCAAPTPD